MDDLSNEVKSAILSQELLGVKQQIYRLSVSTEARKLAGYTDEENRALIIELERLVKMRDMLSGKIDELK